MRVLEEIQVTHKHFFPSDLSEKQFRLQAKLSDLRVFIDEMGLGFESSDGAAPPRGSTTARRTDERKCCAILPRGSTTK